MTWLPYGPRGRFLAASLAGVVLSTVLFGAAFPVYEYYIERVERLAQRKLIASRMALLADGLPVLRALYADRSRTKPSLLAGDTDSIAAAALLSQIKGIAREAGVAIGSIETLPSEVLPSVEGASALRRIALRLVAVANWDAVVTLLASAAAANPRIAVEDFRLNGVSLAGGDPTRYEATLNVVGFRAASGPVLPK